jgi:hypothetical protein
MVTTAEPMMNCSTTPSKSPATVSSEPATGRSVRSFALLAVLVTFAGLAGCRAGTSVLGPPGTMYDQRSRAVLSDPFPNNQLGPAVLGGRPRGFETPLAEPVNVQASPFSELNKTNRGFVQRIFGRF